MSGYDSFGNKNGISLKDQHMMRTAEKQARHIARLKYEETKTLAEQIRLAEERVQYREAKAKAQAVEARLVAIKEWREDKRKRMEAVRKAERAEIMAVQKALEEAREKAKEEKRMQEEEELRIRREKQAKDAVVRGHRRTAGKKFFEKRAKKRNAMIVERAQAEEKERQEKLSKAAAGAPVDDYITIYGTILVTIALLAYIFRCIKIETLKAHARVSLQNCIQYLIDSGILAKAKIAMCYAACAACNLFAKIPCPPLPFFYKNKSTDDEDCDNDDEDNDDDCSSDGSYDVSNNSVLSKKPYLCGYDDEDKTSNKSSAVIKPISQFPDTSQPPVSSAPITTQTQEIPETLVIIKSLGTKTKSEGQNTEKESKPEPTQK